MDAELQIERYLTNLLGNVDQAAMWAILHDKDRVWGGTWTDTFARSEPRLREYNVSGNGIFILVNLSSSESLRKKENIAAIRAVWLEIDGPEMPEVPLEPTMVVRTRNGFHMYWVLDNPSQDVRWGESMNRRICQNYGGDPGAKDVCRVLRMPGFDHMKEEPWPVTLQEDNDVRFSTTDIEDAFGVPERPVERFIEQSGVGVAEDTAYGLVAAAGVLQDHSGAGVGERNAALNRASFRLGCLVRDKQLTEATAYMYARKVAERTGYAAEHSDTEKVIRSGIMSGQNAPAVPGSVGHTLQKCTEKCTEVTYNVTFVQNREHILERITEGIDKRIDMGFKPAPSPMQKLNEALGGGAPAGAVTLLGAPPGMGKSSLALEWAYKHAESGKAAAYLSLELSELDLYARLTTLVHSKESRPIPWIDVRCGRYREELLETVRGSLHLPFYVASRQGFGGVETLRESIDELARKHKEPPLVVIDYLQLMMPAGETREQWAVMADISGEVAHCAQDTGAPIVCITAVNRQSYNIMDQRTGKPDKSLALAAAKQSGRLEYDAEVIMGLQLFDICDAGHFGWICIPKNRSGGTSGTLACAYDGMSGRFSDAEPSDVYAAIEAEREERQRVKNADVEEMVMEAIKDGPPIRSEEAMYKRVDAPRRQVKTALGKLMVEGKIFKSEFHKSYAIKGE